MQSLTTRIRDKIRLFKHFFSSARRRGLTRTVRIAFYEFWYERKLGASTAFVVPVERLDYGEEARSHAEAYFPSSYLFLKEALVDGPIDCDGGVFVDFGCGMGRALLFAATLPFKRVVGVELSSSLCAAASANLERFYERNAKRTPEWEVVEGDVRQFQIPGDANVFYFQNPFDEVVVGQVVDRIVASAQRAPRTCYLVYGNPLHHLTVVNRGFSKLPLSSTDWMIFSYKPASKGRA